MHADLNERQGATRRDLLKHALATGEAVSFPWIVPARALGRGGAVAPSEKITLGVIGIGPRCTYDLKSMLALPDVQCVAICDVQASRREAGKKLVDRHYGNKDCVLYRDFRELLARKDIDAVLIATGDRWHAAGLDPGGPGRQGRLQREAVRADHRQLPGPGRHHQAHRPRLPGRHPAAQRAELPGGRASWPTAASSASSTRSTPRSTRPQLETTWLPGEPTPPQRRGRLGPLAGPGPVAAVQQGLRQRRLARLLRLRLRRPAARLGRAHRRPLPVGQQGRRHHAHRVRAVGRPTSRPATPTA